MSEIKMTLNFSSVIISYLFQKGPVVTFIHLESFFFLSCSWFSTKNSIFGSIYMYIKGCVDFNKDIWHILPVLGFSPFTWSPLWWWKGLLQTLYGGGVSQKIIEGGEHVEILETPTIAKGRLYSGGEVYSCISLLSSGTIFLNVCLLLYHNYSECPTSALIWMITYIVTLSLSRMVFSLPCSQSLVRSGVTTGSAAMYLSLFLARHLGPFPNKIPLF